VDPPPPARHGGLKASIFVGLGLAFGMTLAAFPLRSLWAPVEPAPRTAAAPVERGTAQDDSLADENPDVVSRDDLPFAEPATPASPGLVAVESSPASIEDVVARTLPAVVSIQSSAGRGTGFFVQPDLVLTNAHVVGTQTMVQLQGVGASYSARVKSVSPGTDLALIEVPGANASQATLQLGTAGNLRVGQDVIAIGSALGVLSNTVTRGIVSAVRRAGTVTLIQTDAAINPGNSGGPLIDRTSGLVIGINSMRVAQRAGEGLAFAVASDHAAALLNGQQQGGATPLERLTGSSEISQGDRLRARGEQVYRQAIEAAARNGQLLDDYWSRYAQSCVASATRTGDRAWFAVLEPNGVRLKDNTLMDCSGWLDTLRTNASSTRDSVIEAAEFARRNGVYPGVMRDVRRRFRMEWTGWDR
jgi:S1-C subfamily serine protease